MNLPLGVKTQQLRNLRAQFLPGPCPPPGPRFSLVPVLSKMVLLRSYLLQSYCVRSPSPSLAD